MASFSDIVKYQRSQGAGVGGSLATAIAQSTLQKIDPRNYLFSKTGMATSLFPFLKGYQAKTGQTKTVAPKLQPTVSQVFDKEVSRRITQIDINTRINAKNSMVLPMMARDMNLVRQNIGKLVRINSRGKEIATTKSDMFFKRSGQRESAYESKFKKESQVTTGPGMLSTVAGGIGSVFSGLFSGATGLAGSILGFVGNLGLLSIPLLMAGGYLISRLIKGFKLEGFGSLFSKLYEDVSKSIKSFFRMDRDRPFFEQISEKIKDIFGIPREKNLAAAIVEKLDETFKTNFFKDALITVVSSFNIMKNYIQAFYEEGKLLFENLKKEFSDAMTVLTTGLAGAAVGGIAGSFLRGRAVAQAGTAAGTATGAIARSAGMRGMIGMAARGAGGVLGAIGGPGGAIVGSLVFGAIAEALLSSTDPLAELEALKEEYPDQIDDITYNKLKNYIELQKKNEKLDEDIKKLRRHIKGQTELVSAGKPGFETETSPGQIKMRENQRLLQDLLNEKSDIRHILSSTEEEFGRKVGEDPTTAARSATIRRNLSEANARARSEAASSLGLSPTRVSTGTSNEQILETIKQKESAGGNYSENSIKNDSTASGAYQFLDSTWQHLTKRYGIGTEYPRAYLAPPEIQDAIADKYVSEILQQTGGDVSKVPLVWYTGNAQGQISERGLKANKGLTPEKYQQDWMALYNKQPGARQLAQADTGKKLTGTTPQPKVLPSSLLPFSEDSIDKQMLMMAGMLSEITKGMGGQLEALGNKLAQSLQENGNKFAVTVNAADVVNRSSLDLHRPMGVSES